MLENNDIAEQRLIAAAPELLIALQRLVDHAMHDDYAHYRNDCKGDSDLPCDVCLAKSVIEKATGKAIP